MQVLWVAICITFCTIAAEVSMAQATTAGVEGVEGVFEVQLQSHRNEALNEVLKLRSDDIPWELQAQGGRLRWERTPEGNSPTVPVSPDWLASDDAILPTKLRDIVSDGVLDERILLNLEQKSPTSLDIQTLGYQFPSQPVDIYAAYSDGDFQGLFSERGKRAQNLIDRTYEFIPVVAAWAGDTVSSLSHVLEAALKQVCDSDYRPDQFSIGLEGGVQFFASFKGQITFSFDVDETCARMSVSAFGSS